MKTLSINVTYYGKDRKGALGKYLEVSWFQDVLFDFWHNRAAFHFTTTEDKIYRYVSIAENAIKKDGYLILGTFSENGPSKCNALEVKQYSEASMSARFEVAFDRIKCIEVNHTTPFNTIQNFLFCSFKKK